jgi:hypothetical protein
MGPALKDVRAQICRWLAGQANGPDHAAEKLPRLNRGVQRSERSLTDDSNRGIEFCIEEAEQWLSKVGTPKYCSNKGEVGYEALEMEWGGNLRRDEPVRDFRSDGFAGPRHDSGTTGPFA